MRATLTRAILAAVAVAAAVAAEPAPRVPWAESQHTRFFALRLRPGQDPAEELQKFAAERRLHAAFVASCAGSLTRASIRFANQPQATVLQGHFEIVGLSGTVTGDGRHLHVTVADSTGATFGGHLMPGSAVYTTAEIVLGEMRDVRFDREPDSTFGYKELVPRRR